jgi:hypothetical protein
LGRPFALAAQRMRSPKGPFFCAIGSTCACLAAYPRVAAEMPRSSAELVPQGARLERGLPRGVESLHYTQMHGGAKCQAHARVACVASWLPTREDHTKQSVRLTRAIGPNAIWYEDQEVRRSKLGQLLSIQLSRCLSAIRYALYAIRHVYWIEQYCRAVQ